MEKRILWNKISYLGLDETNQFEHREVVLLNKIVFMSTMFMFMIIPLEVILNGWDMAVFELGMGVLCLVALVLNYYKQYTLAKFYFFFIALAVIFFMGILVGGGAANELFMIPIFLIPLLLFKNRYTVFALCLFCFAAFIALIRLQEVITPVVDISMEIKESFRYIFYTVVFIIIFFGVFYFKGINDRFQELLEMRNKEIEHKNKEIVDSITYARRIQHSILPSDDLIRKLLPDSFVIYKPKDIVAGDFYWLQEQNGKILLAAADCTGHGVPGAMVSVVCDHALHKSVVELGITEPGKILDKTRNLVVAQFGRSSEGVKDGMDIALVSLESRVKSKSSEEEEPETRNSGSILHYSGANNPLWIIRKESQEIEEIKADKQPIGQSDHAFPFTTHTLTLNKGDLFYIFSDGYADQFGGDKGKKLKNKVFKDIILRHREKSMEDQSRLIDETFETWRGEFEQLDDVCIIGVRI